MFLECSDSKDIDGAHVCVQYCPQNAKKCHAHTLKKCLDNFSSICQKKIFATPKTAQNWQDHTFKQKSGSATIRYPLLS